MTVWVALAKVAQPHGVRGQVKLHVLTDPAEKIFTYPNLTLADGTPVQLRRMGQAQRQLIVAIAGVDSRNEAEIWRGRAIGIAQAALPALESATEFYHTELVGMQVVDAAGAPYGVVRQVHNFGAGDILEIGLHGSESELYSFTHANFPQVDRVARVITFHPPEILAASRNDD